ncbi:Na+/H+ antiporter subunit E [Nesterenkonia sp. HG001]|uniref:Na+/H+ antiporter subunit E n=1 Tax=Nesterenkonia sp. HG001 TaxID=2983207 RepID=UPI002AC57EB9|nr:Na+/H+ antiporter subunit E [Nesterenkonia sp. HG001]MDZ5077416.1 Na+/H+ antiporter subunit E [Nesterenkonia sp. HG001]
MDETRGARIRRWTTAALIRGAAAAVLWAGLTHGDPDKAVYGLVSVLAAVALSLWLLPPRRRPGDVGRWRQAAAAASLILWFLRKIVVGGVDVSFRALHPRTRISPEVVRAPLRLAPGPAREIALLMMNLMPGSMVQRVLPGEPESVEIHALAAELRPREIWEELQSRTAALEGRRRTAE